MKWLQGQPYIASPAEMLDSFLEAFYWAQLLIDPDPEVRVEAQKKGDAAVARMSRGAPTDQTYETLGKLVGLLTEMVKQDPGFDALGEAFEQLELRNNDLGQFFTPRTICELSAHTVLADPAEMAGKTVADCACGSGRMLIAAWEMAPDAVYFGQDVNRRAYLMCVTNFALRNMQGEVTQMNTLSGEFSDCIQFRMRPGMWIERVPEKRCIAKLMLENMRREAEEAVANDKKEQAAKLAAKIGEQVGLF